MDHRIVPRQGFIVDSVESALNQGSMTEVGIITMSLQLRYKTTAIPGLLRVSGLI